MSEEKPKPQEPSAVDLARSYIEGRALVDDNKRLMLRFYKGDFLKYTGTHYENFTNSDLEADIAAFLQAKNEEIRVANEAISSPDEKRKCIGITSSKISSIIANLKGIAHVLNQVMPCMLNEPGEIKPDLIAMKNGILNINKLIAGESVSLSPHSPLFFSMTCLPYEYSPDETCPIFFKVLNEMLPAEDVRNMVQEWFGLNLITDTTFQKFLLLVGEGANGKTVLCTSLREMLGVKNVSAISLEQFSPTRTFPLAATVGKLANICEEISEVDKSAEGVLKQIVNGGTLTIERKNRDAFELRPTARLTFATNVLPKFRDRSQGLWRRMILVRFTQQVLDEAKQDKRLTDGNFWQESGELPGIFNWAVEGLKRLKARGHFVEPPECAVEKEAYKQAANPAVTFLTENCVAKAGSEITSSEIYPIYFQWVKDRGGMPLGEPLFAEELRKTFPTVALTEHALRRTVNGKSVRSRIWKSLAWIDTEAPENRGLR